MDLFGNKDQIPPGGNKNKSGSLKVNPCIAVYGKDAAGNKCKNCTHLFHKQYGKKYFKCDLRKNNNSASTDHKANWEACGKFQKREVKNG